MEDELIRVQHDHTRQVANALAAQLHAEEEAERARRASRSTLDAKEAEAARWAAELDRARMTIDTLQQRN